MVIFLAKLNNLEVWGADIGNAYLEAKTKEKLYIVAGPEFEELERHILAIYKALYGLKSSGLRWSQKIHDIMLDIGFSPDRIPSTTPGAEPPRDARDSGSARSHSTHLETSSSDRPKMVTYTEPQTVPSYMSVTCTRQTLRMQNFTRATHAQPSLSKCPKWDSNFGELTHSRRTTLWEQTFPTSPQNKITKLTHCSIYMSIRTIASPHTK